MRFVILIASSMVIFALFAINACAILDGGSGLSVDQLIDASNGIYIPATGIPENPQAARKLWSEERGINFTMPGTLSESGSSPQASRSSVQTGEGLVYQTASTVSSSQAEATSTAGTAITQTISPAASSVTSSATSPSLYPAASVAGDWSFRLRDSKNRILALTLYMSEDTVFGTGTMNDGSDTLKVSASGSVTSDKLNLDVISSGTISLYRLRLAVNDSSASGEYRAFSANSDPWIGMVEGTRAAK
ncbi:MAG: hypothetical protein JW999_07560 [Methanotrichaceae archaeon]|nr:hypothetical protein [Methanotrichaceae archaeon]